MCGRASQIPSERPFSSHHRMDLHGFTHVCTFFSFGNFLVVDPLQPMAGNLPASLAHPSDDVWTACKRSRYPEHGDRKVALREDSKKAPESRSRTVFEHRLNVHVALAEPRLCTQHV